MTPAEFWQIEQQNQANRQEFMQGQQENLMNAIGQFAGQYAENKALDAKGSAYGSFLKNHGEQLGFSGEYLDSLLKMKPRELAVAADATILGNAGNRLMGLNSMQYQANLFGGNRGTGAGGGGGMGARTAAPQESVTF